VRLHSHFAGWLYFRICANNDASDSSFTFRRWSVSLTRQFRRLRPKCRTQSRNVNSATAADWIAPLSRIRPARWPLFLDDPNLVEQNVLSFFKEIFERAPDRLKSISARARFRCGIGALVVNNRRDDFAAATICGSRRRNSNDSSVSDSMN